MSDALKPYDTLRDFITGRKIPNIGAEENRQAIERFLVEEKGFQKEDIEIDVDIQMSIGAEVYRSQIDLVVGVGINATRFMAVKCAAGSLGSREREIVAAARLLCRDYQIPFALVSDGKTALVLDTLTGKKVGEGLALIPSKEQAIEKLKSIRLQILPENRREREKLIFRSYDSMNVNVQRNVR